MFAHVLLPTDGSVLSENAVRKGLQLAKDVNARVTVIHVIAPLRAFGFKGGIRAETLLQRDDETRARAAQILAHAARSAHASQVSCETTYVSGEQPYSEIVRAAEEKGCDLIVMASHGRQGIEGMLLGSQTQKVLTHSKVPVLVYR